MSFLDISFICYRFCPCGSGENGKNTASADKNGPAVYVFSTLKYLDITADGDTDLDSTNENGDVS
ncbi:MAG: hypothetical protein LBG27_00125 [Spirochaetaceae bacterium]|nr:hypothetical protein [Spirochaetaceae bacterium]